MFNYILSLISVIVLFCTTEYICNKYVSQDDQYIFAFFFGGIGMILMQMGLE